METASDDSGLTQPLLPMKGVYGDHDGGEDGDGGGDEQPANTKNKLGTLNGGGSWATQAPPSAIRPRTTSP